MTDEDYGQRGLKCVIPSAIQWCLRFLCRGAGGAGFTVMQLVYGDSSALAAGHHAEQAR